jgi:ferredoxin-NADP reductase/nitrite reductase/ring-hydroxylating ferredoxin subunit
MTATDPSSLLHPVAGRADLVPRHVVKARLLGQDLAVWRADDGFVNVWADRCIHRGVRLTVAANDGAELVCPYHGWRYSNRSGNCAYMPAHPGEAPPRTLRVPTFRSEERYGLIWSGGSPDAEPPRLEQLEGDDTLVMRALPVNAPADLALRGLLECSLHPMPAAGDEVSISSDSAGPYAVAVTARTGSTETTVVHFVQPVDTDRCVIRPVMRGAPAADQRLSVLRYYARQLEELRTALEASEGSRVAVRTPSTPLTPLVKPRPTTALGRVPQVEVSVARKWLTAEGIAAFELAPISGQLPSFQPGAHVDVHLPNGLVRQYSLTNGPGLTSVYRLGVKLEPESRGGSRYMHDSVRPGDTLRLSEPHNNFPLRRDAARTVLIAGGIGVTPLLAMGHTLHRQGLGWELHYFAQSNDHIAFPEVLEPLSEGLVKHLGLSPDQTADAIKRITHAREDTGHLYVCGPGPMIEATRAIAADSGWPDDAVHFEYFKNESEQDDTSSFEVLLARSGQTLVVGEGVSLLDSLRNAGVDMPSSCEQGACGTCMATVLEGELAHQDVYFNNSERAAADRILTCVSRAASERIVLDL